MKLILITRPDFFPGEAALINALFRAGLERLHLRKPGASSEELAEWLMEIDPSFRHLIVLHDHHELALDYHLGGVHLNSRNPKISSGIQAYKASAEGFTISRSCHSLGEVEEALAPHFSSIEESEPVGLNFQSSHSLEKDGSYSSPSSLSSEVLDEVFSGSFSFDYVFLSPIFNSISKPGYNAAFTQEQLLQAAASPAFSQKVYALGGVSAENLPQVSRMGFAGAVLLGDVWQAPSPVQRFSQLLEKIGILL